MKTKYTYIKKKTTKNNQNKKKTKFKNKTDSN